MKNNFVLPGIIASMFVIAIFFSACKKDHDNPANKIQEGNTTIEMNAIYTGLYLQVRYNNAINAPINATVRVYQNGKAIDAPVNIPAGYKSLQNWTGNDYLNIWNYNGFYDSTGTNHLPVITGTVDSLRIIAASCPDKEYGFKIIGGDIDWSHYYHPTDPKTTVSFTSNTDAVFYSDYDFNNRNISYIKTSQIYFWELFNHAFLMVSATKTYPLQQGMTIDIPLIVYYWNGRNNGSQPDGPEAHTNGSTLQLTITKLTGTHFDATFSGKVWSSRQADTLFISNGEIKDALLPVIK